MYGPRREQTPLLLEESDEDLQHTKLCMSKNRYSDIKGRAKYRLKGAASLISKWPDHWSSSVFYWWVALGIFALFIMIMYNSFLALFIIPVTSYSKSFSPFSLHNSNVIEIDRNCEYNQPEVVMHVITEDSNNVDLAKLAKAISKISNKYTSLKYSLVIVINDTVTPIRDEHEMNMNALNQIMSEDITTSKTIMGIAVDHVSLTYLLKNSPAKNYWREIPNQFIPFVIRTISVWDRGGIALNPFVILPDTLENVYYYKHICHILEQFESEWRSKMVKNKRLRVETKKDNPRFNNIQEIINAIASNAQPYPISQENLTEVENAPSVAVDKNTIELHDTNLIQSISLPNLQRTETDKIENNVLTKFKNHSENNGDVRNKLLKNGTRKSRSLHNRSNKSEVEDILLNDIPYEAQHKSNSINNYTSIKFFVDLKGEVVASNVPCHAFLDAVFKKLQHQHETNVTDFLVKELSTFCKGNLNSCQSKNITII